MARTPEEQKQYMREYYLRTKHKRPKRERKPETDRVREALYRKNNSDKINEISKRWRTANPERMREHRKAWLDKYRSEHSETYHNKYFRERLKVDPNFDMAIRLRRRLWAALKHQGATRCTKHYALIGCSKQELAEHIQSQFLDGMTWDNRSEWHIDHIRPCCSFDLTDPDQQRECFNFKNLRPLWKRDNQTKGGKFIDSVDSE